MVEKTVEKTVARTSLGVVKTSLGVVKTSLGVIKTSLGVIKTSLGVIKTSLGKACMRTTHLLLLSLRVPYPNRHQHLRRSHREVQQLRLMLSPGVESIAFPISSSQVEAVSPGHLFQGKFHLQSGSVCRYGNSITQPHDFVRLGLLELKESLGYRL